MECKEIEFKCGAKVISGKLGKRFEICVMISVESVAAPLILFCGEARAAVRAEAEKLPLQ